MDILDDLKYRGLIYQASDLDGLRKELKKGMVTLYCGFDPTADSLHIGSLLPILTLKRFQEAGHQPIALVGGGTGLIGDPSGKREERVLNPQKTVTEWGKKVKNQLEQFLDFQRPKNPAIMANNYDWLGKIKAIDFLRDVGKNFTVSYMLAKESVKLRLAAGISFTEFNYMVLQAYDFLNLLEKYHCRMQIGGSDQWGNITAGIDLIKKQKGEEAYGLTVPLVSKADGTKFGKTESGTIWLDAKKTPPYRFYQFWVNTDDQDVITYLKYFTFLQKEEIESLQKDVSHYPEKREAQKLLARQVTSLVHGPEAAGKTESLSQKLFYGEIQNFSAADWQMIFAGVSALGFSHADQMSLADLLVQMKISSSKRQAREDITHRAVDVNGQVIVDPQRMMGRKDCLFNKYMVIKKGKKNYYFILWK